MLYMLSSRRSYRERMVFVAFHIHLPIYIMVSIKLLRKYTFIVTHVTYIECS